MSVAGLAVLTPTADLTLIDLLARMVDVVILDLEHAPITDDAAAGAILAAHGRGARIVIRSPVSEPARAARFLDAGGDGVIAARVETAAVAAAWTAAAHPPPDGLRGVGASPANAYGRDPLPRPWVCVQVETVAAVDDVDRIAATPGLSALMVGERDLSYSFGLGGELDHPRVREAQARVAAAARDHALARAALAGREPPGMAAPDLLIVGLPALLERGIREVKP